MEEQGQQKKSKMSLILLIVLQGAVCLYTVSGIAAKLASNYEFLSLGFILCYGLEIFVLGLYAIIWQQIIKRVDISIAYANRAVAVFWTMLWSILTTSAWLRPWNSSAPLPRSARLSSSPATTESRNGWITENKSSLPRCLFRRRGIVFSAAKYSFLQLS